MEGHKAEDRAARRSRWPGQSGALASFFPGKGSGLVLPWAMSGQATFTSTSARWSPGWLQRGSTSWLGCRVLNLRGPPSVAPAQQTGHAGTVACWCRGFLLVLRVRWVHAGWSRRSGSVEHSFVPTHRDPEPTRHAAPKDPGGRLSSPVPCPSPQTFLTSAPGLQAEEGVWAGPETHTRSAENSQQGRGSH